MQGQTRVSRMVSHTTSVKVDATNILEKLPSNGGFAWLTQGLWMAGWGEAVRISPAPGPSRFDEAASLLQAIFDSAEINDEVGITNSGPIAFGSFTFDERSLGSALIVPEVVIGFDGVHGWLTVNSMTSFDDLPMRRAPEDVPMDLRTWETSNEAWLSSANKAIEMLRGGALKKVVLARGMNVAVANPQSASGVLAKLAQRFPGCFNFGFYNFVGSSPELLLRKRGSSVESIPLAGSAKRSANANEDRTAGESLLSSGKERSEHRLAVDSVVDALKKICREVRVDPEPHLVKLANVQHLGTRVTAECIPEQSVLELVGAVHPTAAVCGTPTADALSAIRALEPADRGRYSGPVGWISAKGDGEWAIALRCAEIRGKSALVHAGAGLVEGSRAEDELEEIEMKLEAILQALG